MGADRPSGQRQRRTGRVDGLFLRQIPLFGDVAERDLRRLAEVGTWRRYKQGELIVQPGDQRGCVFIVVQGEVRIFGAAPNRDEISVLFLTGGEVIDFNDLPPGLVDDAYAEATGEGALVCRLPRKLFHEAVFACPRSARALDAQARQRLMELALLVWELAFHDAQTRLCHVLARLAERDAEHMVWDQHGELARMTRISREEVTRVLGHLRARGLIADGSRRRGIKVLDIDRLASAGLEGSGM